MTPQHIKHLFPNASRSTLEANSGGLVSNPSPKRDKASALGRAAAREKESLARIVVCFTGFRVQPLDPDGFAGSVKDLLDGVKHAHLIPEDNFWTILLVTGQEKCDHFDEERTQIDIFWP